MLDADLCGQFPAFVALCRECDCGLNRWSPDETWVENAFILSPCASDPHYPVANPGSKHDTATRPVDGAAPETVREKD
ncbi:hypothetical protein [Halomicrococcus sp. NG-SE-24]|uniref:hypothetical protein n=1 Tax=Halomicrococcus sp. NG-SE-24 TaxID=3436928 RepID=UPI003D95E38F